MLKFEMYWVYMYVYFRSFSRFLGQRFCLERALEKLRISWVFKAFSRADSWKNITPKSRENDREGVYTPSC